MATEHQTENRTGNDKRTVSRRQLVKTGTLSAGVLVTLALLLIVNYLGWKYHHRFDWTASRLYTLSDKSENVLKKLDREVDFVVFIAPQNDLYQPVKELLSRYDAVSHHVHTRIVDAERNPVEAQQLVKQYGVTSAGVVVVSGKDRRVIDVAELAEMDFSGMQMGQAPQMTGFKGEQLFTGAILQLEEGRKPKVLFTTGHGERSLDDRDVHGLSSIQELLGPDNFQLEEWSSLGKNAVPPGTDLVVLAGPTNAFLKPELDALTAYLNGGGRVLALVDPTLSQASSSAGLIPTGLDEWLAGYGVKVGEDIVVDPTNVLPSYSAQVFFANDYGSGHPITKPLAQSRVPVLLNMARSVAKGTAAPGLQVSELLRTSAEGWGETDLAHLEKVGKDARDLQGPVPLGIAVERPGQAGQNGLKKMRLVVFGDSDFATNQLVQGNPANAVLLSNSLNWLVERESLLTIPAKKSEQVRLTLTSEQRRTLFLLTLVILPGLAASCGALVYVRRKRR
jgi:ABC-type uncharacterized transport system involved in gliding motility auxiliary subunit